MTQLTLMQAA